MKVETELKLEVPCAELDGLARLPAIAALIDGPPQCQQLVSIYYDSPDLELRRSRVSLRIRHVGDKRLICVKTGGRRSGGLFARGEWEEETAAHHPDPLWLARSPVAGVFAAMPHLTLAQVFKTDVARTSYRLAGDGFEIELALDRGCIEACGQRQEVCEAELELVTGAPRHLYEVAAALQDQVHARPMLTSKSERGYALLTGERPQPSKAKTPAVSPDQTVAEAFHTIAHGCVAHMLANEPSLVNGRAPDAVHQMRVAVRRLRSAMHLFRPAIGEAGDIADELRWLVGELGPARDSDVFLADILGPVQTAFPDAEGLSELAAEFAARRDKLYDRAVAAVASPRFAHLALAVGGWIETGDWPEAASRPVRGFARDLLDRRARKIAKKGGKKLAALDAESRHRLRIQIKKLRYACEFFAPLWPGKATGRGIDLLAALQESLGGLNDVAVARGLLSDHPPSWELGLVLGWHEAHHDRMLGDAQAAWKRWRKGPPFWRD